MAQYLKTNKILFLMILIITVIMYLKIQPIHMVECESMQWHFISPYHIEQLAKANLDYISHDECFYSEVIMEKLRRITPDYTCSCYANEDIIENIIKRLENKFDETSNMVYLHAIAKIWIDHKFHILFTETDTVLLTTNYDLSIKMTLINMCRIKFLL